jgi:energy-coupling factor transport system ATP-binding protein
MEEKESAVRFDHVSFAYDSSKKTIDDVSFDIYKGQYVCLVGHNGSGKSTLAKLVIGLLEQNKGDIYIFGKKAEDKNILELRKDIGIVFQNPDNQFIASTVREDIAFGLENECVSEEKMEVLVDEYGKKVGMQDFLDREPSQLSGGQKQRVAIAGALVRSPKILILDEATSMLDPKGKREIISLIHQAKKDNPSLTILSITHDIEEAYSSDRVLVISDGHKVLDGTPYEVFSDGKKMQELALDMPFFLRLSEALEKEGIDVGNPSSLDEVIKALCR